jgi:response regulator RpfG family c-di-GMP phosphodiesterase
VTDRASPVLLAGVGSRSLEAIAPVLDQQNLEVTSADTPEDAVEMASEKKFDLVIFDAETGPVALADLVARLRDNASASSGCSLLVVAGPRAAYDARDQIGRGVNRVVNVDDPGTVIEKHLAELLDVAPRAKVQLVTRVTYDLANGSLQVDGQTANVSLNGMLLQTTTTFEPGQEVVFEFMADERGDVVSGRGEIVRSADAGREGLQGIAIRFTDFDGDGRERIEALLADSKA